MTASSDGGRRTRTSIRRIALPDVRGLHLRDASIVLRNAGFNKHRVHYIEDYASEFEVVAQFPRYGMLTPLDAEIALKVSRQSFVSFLPQVFQQAAMGEGSFLKGFLYVIQTMHDGVQAKLEHIHDYFDPRTTDQDFLPWLAGWLALSMNPDWNPLERRKMLMAAAQLFPVRGTATAIRDFVKIYVDANVVIEENAWPFQGFRIGVQSTVGEDTVILPSMNLAHCFVVRLDKKASEVSDDEIVKIHQIIQSQKPSHLAYFLAFQDEVDAGEMGAFMTIGGVPPSPDADGDGEAAPVGFGIGLGGGMGIGAAPVETTTDPSKQSDETASAKQETKPDRGADAKPRAAAAKAKTGSKAKSQSTKAAATSSKSTGAKASTSARSKASKPKASKGASAKTSKSAGGTRKTTAAKSTRKRKTKSDAPEE